MYSEYGKLAAAVDGLKMEVLKAHHGNKSAGARVRKGVQAIKKLAQELKNAAAPANIKKPEA